MKGSRKGGTPPKMQAWLGETSADWSPAYPFDSTDVRTEIRETLLREQRGLCVYCGRLLKLDRPGETYHVEHFRPQTVYGHLAVEFSNLFLSCGQKDDHGNPSPTCGNFKASWFDEALHVDPNYPDCVRRYKFTLNGYVESALAGDVSAVTMVEKLNLNHPELVKDRADVLTLLDGGDLDESDFFSTVDKLAKSNAHVAYQHLGLTLP